MAINWIEKSVRLKDLRPFEQNPRRITKEQFDKLLESLREDGYHSRIKATNDLRVIGGHMRLRALKELGFDKVDILVPDCDLTDDEFKRILVRDNHNNGIFDLDVLSSMFDLEELRHIGIHEVNLIPPEDAQANQDATPPKSMVKCPECAHVFPTKGNKFQGDL